MMQENKYVKNSQDIFPDNIFFTWDIQYQCNYHCTYCFLFYEKNTANIKTIYLDSNAWLKIWKDIHAKYGQCQIQITGGEPFAYPDFMNLIGGLSKLHTLSFSTNLFWDAHEFMSKVTPDRVKIDSSYHPEFTDLESFLEKILLLKKNDYLINVTMVAYPPMFEKIKLQGNAFKDNGVNLVIYPYRGPFEGRFYPEGYTENEKAALGELGLKIGAGVSKSLKEQHFAVREMTESLPFVGERYNPALDKTITPKSCRMGQCYAKIVPNGDVYRCCAAVWDETKSWVNWGNLGNLAHGTFALLKQQELCYFWQNCICYKAMIVGEEQKWFKDWNTVEQIKENLILNEELTQAKTLRDRKNIGEAVEKLKEILTKKPQEVKALTLLGEIYIEAGKFDEAIEIISKGIADNLDPNNFSWLYRVIGKIYSWKAFADNSCPQRDEHVNSALENLTKAIGYAKEYNNPVDESQANYEIAYIYYLLNKFDRALEYMAIAAVLDSENHFLKKKKELWGIEKELYAIKCLRDEGRFEEAIEELKKFLKNRPAYVQALALLGEIYIEAGKFDEAIEVVSEGIANNHDSNDFSWLYRIMGRIYSRKAFADNSCPQCDEYVNSALENLTKAVQYAKEHGNPIDESKANYEIAYVYFLLNKFDSALECITTAMILDPKNNFLKKKKELWETAKDLYAIKCLRDEGRFEEAIEGLKKFLKNRPAYAQALALLGEIYIVTDKLDEAIEVIGKGIAHNHDPKDFSWLYRVLGRIYSRKAFADNSCSQRDEHVNSALENLTKAVQYAKEHGNPIDESQANYEIAYIYFLLGDPDNARIFIRNISIPKEIFYGDENKQESFRALIRNAFKEGQ